MKVELINTGTELLLGHVINSHLPDLGKLLFPLGLRIVRQVTVPDGPGIRDALAEAFVRADIVIATGGLGPTSDDITRDVAAELLGLEMEENAEVISAIQRRFAARNLSLNASVRRQAQVPRGAVVLPNDHGTAPGLYFPADTARHSPHLFLLPGPPSELRPMAESSLVPMLRQLGSSLAPVECRTFVVNLPESVVEQLVGEAILAIEGIELGYCPRRGQVEVRYLGSPGAVARAEAIVLDRLGPYRASLEERSIEQIVVATLRQHRQTLAVAESCTGGYLASRITNVPGASDVFIEGFVTYANEAKTHTLDVAPSLLNAHGAVSAEVARSLAQNARNKSGADYALSLTGIAGPAGGTPDKPVGTVFIGLSSAHDSSIEHHRFEADRLTFKLLASQTALEMLRARLDSSPAPVGSS